MVFDGDYMIGIYKICNIINHKVYIGQSIDIQRRFSDHIRSLKNGCHFNEHLQASYNKYGPEAFVFEVECICQKEELDDLEVFIIQQYNSINPKYGYNKETGGSNNKIISEETREKYRINNSGSKNPFYGKKHTEEYCEKMKVLSGLHRHSKESKYKISENHADVSGSNNPRCRAIYCPELDELFWGAKEAQDKYGVNRNNICTCLRGRLQSAGKHPITGQKLTWVYADINEHTTE